MRYEDASGTFQASGPIANDDSDTLTAGSRGPATGNLITGEGTQYGSAGADSAAGAQVTAIAGKGGEDTSFAAGKLSVTGEFGQLSVDAQGNYSYLANTGAPENVRDRFIYTLADNQGNSDTAALIVEIGKTPVVIKADAQQIVPGPDGVVTLPPGVELSDIMVVGRNLVVNMPDGTQLIIVDGAIFVPQLVLGGVEVPSTNVAALLIGQEVQPAAGETPPSGGGNFALPPPPLDPGIPLGDLLPPTELTYIPPEPQEVFDILDREPDAGAVAAQLDDDALAGGIAGGTGDDPDSVGVTGFLPGSGGDGDLTWSLLLTGAPAGFTYVDGPGESILVQQGGVTVLTITVDPATGEYTVVQNATIDHAAGQDENNVEFVIGYLVTDQDGDTAAGTLTVNVDDDTPTVDVTVASDANVLLTTQDAETDGVPTETDTATSAAHFGAIFGATSAFGADGAGTLALSYSLSTTGGASGLTSHGAAINLYLIGGVVVGSTAGSAGAVNAGNTIFDISVSNTGVVTVNQYSAIDHTNTDPSPTESPFEDHLISLADGAVTLTRTGTITDGDGDTVTDTASVGIGANIRFADDGPIASVNQDAPLGEVVLDETRPVTTDTDDGDPVATLPKGVASGTIDFSDNFAAPVYGADGPGTTTYKLLLSGTNVGSGLYALEAGDTDPGIGLDSDEDGYGQGDEIVLNINAAGTVITGTAGGQTYFTITIDPATGIVTFAQLKPIWHPVIGDFDDEVTLNTDALNDIQVQQTVTDFDGDTDTAAIGIGRGVFSIQDDGPDPFEECPEDVITVNAPGSVFEGDLNLPDPGEDVPAAVTFGVADGDPVEEEGGDPVTSGGIPLFYFINEDGVLEARVGDATGEVIFTITLNPGDDPPSFTYEQFGTIDGAGGGVSFDNLTGADAGNVDYRTVGHDDPTTAIDLILSGSNAGGGDEGVNTDSDSIGVDNQSMDLGETLRIDFVSNLESAAVAAGTPMGLTYDDHVDTSSFIQTIPQVQGEQDQTVAFQVWALDTSDTQADEPDRYPVGGFANSSSVTITEVTVIGTAIGETNPVTEDISALAVGVWEEIAYGVSVQKQADGSVIFSGVQQGDQYGIATGANTFNAVAVQSEVAGTGPEGEESTQDSFDLGVFAIGAVEEPEPIDLEIPIVYTDADGDAVVCDIDIHLGVPLDTDDITVTVDEAGLDEVGSSPGSDTEFASGDILPLISGGTEPYTFELVGDVDEDGILDGLYGTLQLNPDGTFTYELKEPFDTQPDTDDGTNPELNKDSFEVIVTDDTGATQTITIRVNIIDDVPSVDVTVNNEGAVLLTTQDADTIGIATDQDATAINFGGAFGITTVPGADGQQSLTTSYSLAVLNSVSGLTSGGAAINLYMVGDVVVGAIGAQPADLNDTDIVFTISVSDTGVVTLRQMQQIDHPIADDPDATDAPFDDHLIALANGKVTLTRESTITDNDGDTDTDSAVIDLGGNIRFADHGPDAKNDVDEIASGGDTAEGNVISGAGTNAGTLNADVVGADVPGRVTGVVSVNEPGNTDQDPDPDVFEIDGEFGTLVLNANGNYTYTRFDGAPGDAQDVFTYTLTDRDGDTDTATLTINIDDAAPNLPDPAALLLDDDVVPGEGGILDGPGDDNPDANPPGNVASGDLNGTGGDGTLTYNFTNAHTLPLGMGFSIGAASDADTLLIVQTQNGSPVTVLTIQLDQSTGEFTVTQNNAILHDPTNPGAGVGQAGNFEDNLTFLIGVEVEDADHDVEPATITIHVDDDTPVVSNVAGGASVTLDETSGSEPVSSGPAIIVSSLTPVITATTAFGADGQAAVGHTTYGLSLAGGVNSLASGLQTAVGDHPITLVLIDSDTIEGQYTSGGTQVAFIIEMNDDGTITVTQNTALEHLSDGSTPAHHDDSLDLVLDGGAMTNLINATITIKDADGDSHSGSTPIGDQITFKDDGPSINVTKASDTNIQLITDDDGTEGSNSTSDSTAINFDGAFAIGSSNGGGDGTASVSSLSYSLATAGGASGLFHNGAAINLYMVGTTVVGAVGSQPADLNDTDIVFTVSVSGSGVVTLTQLKQIDHPDEAPGATDAPFNDQTISMLNDSLITLTASATITDNDGDTNSDSETINIASNLVFRDDGPTIDATLKQGASIHIDESDPGTDGAGETDNPGLGQVTVALTAIVDVTENPVSADQPTTVTDYDLVLGTPGGNGLVASGLVTSDGNLPIYLYLVGDVVFGSTALVAPVAVDANTVFTVAIVGGNVVMTQYQAVEHPTGGSSHDENTTGLAANALQLKVTAEDFDGDTDTDNVDLGSIITFGDDGPAVIAANTVGGTVDEDGVPNGIPGGIGDFPGEPVVVNGSVATLFDPGSDTPLSYSLNPVTTGLPSLTADGLTVKYDVTGNLLTAYTGATKADGQVFTLQINADGTYTFTLIGNLDHLSLDTLAGDNTENDLILNLGTAVVATDADGDTVVANANQLAITVDDDTPGKFTPDAVASLDGNQPPVIGNLNLHMGADGLRATNGLVFDIVNNTIATDQNGNELKLNGQTLYLFGDGTTQIVASTAQNGGGTIAFTVTLNSDGTYTFDVNGTITNGTATSFTNLTSTSAGNLDFAAIGANLPANNPNNIDVLLSAQNAANAAATVNTDSDSIGINNQSIAAGEIIRFDLVTNLTSPAGTTSGFNFSQYTGTDRWQQEIAQVGGDPNNTVSIKVGAVMEATQDQNFTYDFTTRDAGENLADINSVTIYNYAKAGNSKNFIAQGTVTDPGNPGDETVNTVIGGANYSVTFHDDGTVTINGLGATDEYAIETASVFNQVLVESVATNTTTYDLGIFTLGRAAAGTPIDQNFTVVANDGDSDEVVGTVQTTIVQTFAGNSVGGATGTTLTGDTGNNTIAGNAGNDTINAGAGNDFLYGGAGNDILNGEGGNDILRGDTGVDTLTGGAGTDTFVLSNAPVTDGGNADVIVDYAEGEVIDITQILSVAGAVDVTTGAYVRVTNAGAVQVDLTGNGDGAQWVTVATISNIGAVTNITIKYDLSDGATNTVVVPKSAPPVVLDMDGDGVEFSSGAYDYGNGLVSTAWVGSDDAILVRDANGNGTVDGAAEFVFAYGDFTDLQALHAQYGEQLDASDADFTMFAVWNDANSNGMVDSNELQSLPEAGIASIGLVSDGVGYAASNGEVVVAGTATYTRTDGSTGDVADAAFVIGGARTGSTSLSYSSSNDNVKYGGYGNTFGNVGNTGIVAGMVAAAGMQAIGSASSSSFDSSYDLSGSQSFQSMGMQLVSGDAFATGHNSQLEGLAPGGVVMQAAKFEKAGLSLDDHADFGSLLGTQAHGSAMSSYVPTFAADLAPSFGSAGSVVPVAPAVGMVSAEMLIAAGLVETAKHTGLVEEVLVDALGQGGAPTVDGLLAHLSGGLGDLAALSNAASPAAGGVPAWDMGMHGGSGFAAHVQTQLDAMLQHHDAVQPAVNG